MRRRLRRQRQMREALLLDLGALVFELHRQGRREPDLLQAKAAELMAVDEEVRSLAEALDLNESVMQLVATGVAGSCENCGALMSVDARFCASCGAPAVPALSGDGEGAPVAFPGAREGDVPGAAAEVEDLEEEPAAMEAGTEEFEPVPEEEFEPDEAPVAEEEEVEVELEFDEEPELAEEFEVDPELEDAELVPEDPEAIFEDEDEEPEAEPTPWAGGGEDGDRAATPQSGPAPRAVADDVLDQAGRAIRGGMARGRRWLRGRSGSQ